MRIVGLSLGIFDSDVEYSSQLMGYIKRRHKTIKQIRMFTNKTILYDFLSDNYIDVLLISEDKLNEGVEHENIKHICILSEETYVSEEDNKRIIYKFQSVEQIIIDLFNFFPELSENSKLYYSNEIKIISTFSLNETLAKDNFSFNLANHYGTRKKTLFIDLNLLHAKDQFSELKSDKNLSEFLYYLKVQPLNILSKMNEQTQVVGNFNYLYGVTFGLDLYDLTSKDLETWINQLKTSDYKVIIFNVGCFFSTTLELFRRSNELFLVMKNNMWEESLYNNLKEQLKWTGYEDIIEKIKVVNIDNEISKAACEQENNNVFSSKWGDIAESYATIN